MPLPAAYLHGIGRDVSLRPELEGTDHLSLPLDNTYTLLRDVGAESLDFVYSRDVVNATKYHRILLKEWSYACKVGGHIVVEMRPNGLLGFEELAAEAGLVLGGVARTVQRRLEGDRGTLVLEKTSPSLAPGDSMDSFTFGIITNGLRNDWVERQIRSIRALGIPRLEIIVCGTYFDRAEPGFRYIEFKERDDKGWITRKKNLICQAATHENLVVVHDKMIFDPGWYAGMRRYGNHFEVLSCVIHDERGGRAGDWVTSGADWGKLVIVGNLDYRDWDPTGYVIGMLYVLKRSVGLRIPWDESRYWGQREDLHLSRAYAEAGVVTRFNPFSRVLCLYYRNEQFPDYAFDPLRRGRLQNVRPSFYWAMVKRLGMRYVLRGR